MLSSPYYSLLKLTVAVSAVLIIIFYNICHLLIVGEPAIKSINNIFSVSVFFIMCFALLTIVKSSSNYLEKNAKPIVFMMMGVLILGVAFMSIHIGLIFARLSGEVPSIFCLVLIMSVWGLLYFMVDPMADMIMEKKVPVLSNSVRFGMNVTFILFAYLMYENDFSSEYTFYFTIAALLQIGFRFVLVSTLFMCKDKENKLIVGEVVNEK